jgi:indolepyruvate ferredoxin oxidoreductase
MAEKIDMRFLRDRGAELFNGNELLVKGALETEGGVHLLTGYPGSPVAGFFDVMAALAPVLCEKGIEGRIANNEALAVAAVNGSQMSPLRAMAVMKSVGAHVASDGLALGNLAGAHAKGGGVIVIGDDPWSESTQVPADSRYLCQHLHMPVIEPSTPQEIKDFVDLAFKLSQASGFYIGYVLTTTLADGGGGVECRPNHYPLTNAKHRFELVTAELDTENTVLLPPRTGRKEVALPERRRALIAAARTLGINRLEHGDAASDVLIITADLPHQYVTGTLADWGLLGAVPILKLGLTYPLDVEQIESLARRFAHILVVEERRPFIEDQVLDIVARDRQRGGDGRVASVWGKEFPRGATGFPSALGFNSSIVADRLARFLRAVDSPLAHRAAAPIQRDLTIIGQTAETDVDIPARTPTFCPGCPHRDSSNVLLDIKHEFADTAYMKKRFGRGPVDLVFHGDTGCYTMLMFEPNAPLMHNYSGMGLGGGTGSGIDPFITNKQVVFMGDSTFFHSGQAAISNSLAANQDITYIILDNGTTAMTGHQPHAGVQEDLLGRLHAAQDIEEILRAMTNGRNPVARVNPADRPNYKRLLEETILADGVKFLIADKECGITFNRRVLRAERAEQRRRGYVRRKAYMNITPEVCEFCLECANRTGCPGLNVATTDYGPKMATDLSWCVNDTACAKLDACPSFEQVIVTRKRPPRPRGHEIRLENLPEPAIQFPDGVWRAWLAGVGGMGIGTAASILVRAGFAEGYNVQFADKKGLAIRNGAVFSQIVYTRDGDPHAMTIPYGQADLLLGIDMLEAVRAVDPHSIFRVASPGKTATVVNADKTPTVRMLMGLDDFAPAALEATLRQVSKPGGYYGHPISTLCERLFGTKLYANITMLGVAYQLGLIPVSLDSIKAGIHQSIRADFKKNLRAFNLGRKLITNPELFRERTEPRTLARTVREKTTYLNMRRIGSQKALRSERPTPQAKLRLPDTRMARAYKHLVYTTLRACRELDKETMRDIAVRMYDLVQWGGIRYARRYAQRIRRVFLTDDERHGFAATRVVAWQLAKLMLIKDEFYVPYLLTSYEKLRRDRQRYNVNPANGDRIKYVRTFHPRFLGRKLDVTIPHWTLYVVREFRWMRKLMPWFHRRERDFLKWYERIVDEFAYASDDEYQLQLERLRTVEPVNGYAEYRDPKMATARHRAADVGRKLARATSAMTA